MIFFITIISDWAWEIFFASNIHLSIYCTTTQCRTTSTTSFIGIWSLDTERRTIFWFKNNLASLIDTFVQYGKSTEKYFYQIVNTKEQTILETNGQLASVYFRFDPQFSIYERRIYSFGELLGQIGGLFQIILMSGIIIVHIFPEKLFVSSIIKKIYQIDQIRENFIKKSNKNLVKSKHLGSNKADNSRYLDDTIKKIICFFYLQ